MTRAEIKRKFDEILEDNHKEPISSLTSNALRGIVTDSNVTYGCA
jgi:hypothetical protein